MTIENANTILKQYRDKKAKESGWFLSRKHIDLDYTKLITNWTSNPVIDLPEISEFPHFKMDKTGLDFGTIKYKWSEICATAIMSKTVETKGDNCINVEYLIFCLENGTVIESDLGLTKHYQGQLGHFIELYKAEFTKLDKTANL